MTISIPDLNMSSPIYPHLENREKAAGAKPGVGLVREKAELAALGQVYDCLTEKERKSAVRR